MPRWKRYAYTDLLMRDRLDLNLAWMVEDGASGPATLPLLVEIAANVADELDAALQRFRAVECDWNRSNLTPPSPSLHHLPALSRASLLQAAASQSEF